MILCIDVAYDEQKDENKIGCVLIKDFFDEKPYKTYELVKYGVHAYIPGQFYKRELPCIMHAIDHIRNDGEQIDTVIVDGYCFLEPGHIGLGEHLFQELKECVTVVGVAKTKYKDADCVIARNGLFVSASGITKEKAAEYVELMHGKHKNPSILKIVDHLSRGIYNNKFKY